MILLKNLPHWQNSPLTNIGCCLWVCARVCVCVTVWFVAEADLPIYRRSLSSEMIIKSHNTIHPVNTNSNWFLHQTTHGQQQQQHQGVGKMSAMCRKSHQTVYWPTIGCKLQVDRNIWRLKTWFSVVMITFTICRVIVPNSPATCVLAAAASWPKAFAKD